MPNYIVKLTDEDTKTDYYLDWSTVEDAPITNGKSLEQFKKYYEYQYGRDELQLLADRLARVEKNGVSGFPPFDNLSDLIMTNRAGKNERHLSKKMIIQEYCKKQIS